MTNLLWRFSFFAIWLALPAIGGELDGSCSKSASGRISDPLRLGADIGSFDLVRRSAALGEIPRTQENFSGPKGLMGRFLRYSHHQVVELSIPLDTDVASQSQRLYESLFEIAASRALGDPRRVWNYIPFITELDSQTGQERYVQFNLGRQNAWPRGQGTLPAATGIGDFSKDRRLRVIAMFGTGTAVSLENPRQTPAWQYVGYGPKPPLFARGLLAPEGVAGRGDSLWISGTASILGQDTVHVGNVLEQTEETLRNLVALINQKDLHDLGYGPQSLSGLEDVIVYVKRAEDIAGIQAVLSLRGVRDPSFVVADICRKNLLVEIEARLVLNR